MHSSLCLDCTIERKGLEVAQADLELPLHLWSGEIVSSCELHTQTDCVIRDVMEIGGFPS